MKSRTFQKLALLVFVGLFSRVHAAAPDGAPAPATPNGSSVSPATVPSAPSSLTRQKLTEDEVRAQLRTLNAWGYAAQYRMGLFFLAGEVNLLERCSAEYASILTHPGFTFNPIESSDKDCGIKLEVAEELKTLSIPEKKYGICVRIDGLGYLVPAPAAEIFAIHFVNGFVTRYVLGEIRGSLPKGVNAPNLDFIVPSSGNEPKIPADFVLKSSYKDGAFLESLSGLLEKHSLQSIGLIYGWKAASQLFDSREAKYQQAAKKLLLNRFDTVDLGRITGYTLDYLSTFAYIASLRNAAAGGPGAPLTNEADIVAKYKSDTRVGSLKRLGDTVNDFFAAAQHQLARSDEKNDLRPACADAYFKFTTGFAQGRSDTTPIIFAKIYKTGYVIGYDVGFREGYDKGYKDGYAIGYAKAWDEANRVIADLQKRLNDTEESNGLWGSIGSAINLGLSVFGSL